MKIKKFKQRENTQNTIFFPITHSILQKATSKGQERSQELDFFKSLLSRAIFSISN